MTEPRSRSRKVTRKAGPPEANEAPVFQAPEVTDAGAAEHKPEGNANKGGGRGRNTNKRSSNRSRRGGNDASRTDSNGNRNERGGRGRERRNVVKSMQGADLTERLPQPPKAPKNGLRIYALGGISEIGRNMTVFEYNNRLLIVDCGVLFPSSGEPGVDLVLPDFGPIENQLDRVEALVVTHGHEDHIGAIPWLLKLRPDT